MSTRRCSGTARSTTSGIGESYTGGMVAIVTGASTGLGRAIADLLVQRMPVVGVSRRAPADAAFAHVESDASHPDTALRAIEAAERLGAIALLVNAAGVGIFGPAGSYGEKDIDLVLDANLKATIVFCDALFQRFKEHGGTIVNVLSTAALVG